MNYNTVILPQVLLCSLSEGTMTFPGKEREECLACKLFVTVPDNMTPRPTCYLSKKTEVTGSSQGLNKIQPAQQAVPREVRLESWARLEMLATQAKQNIKNILAVLDPVPAIER